MVALDIIVSPEASSARFWEFSTLPIQEKQRQHVLVLSNQ